jgi:hypothetical protein
MKAKGWGLISITFFLVAVGCGLYVFGYVGWAQMCWVMASGTAGAGLALLIESEDR